MSSNAQLMGTRQEKPQLSSYQLSHASSLTPHASARMVSAKPRRPGSTGHWLARVS